MWHTVCDTKFVRRIQCDEYERQIKFRFYLWATSLDGLFYCTFQIFYFPTPFDQKFAIDRRLKI